MKDQWFYSAERYIEPGYIENSGWILNNDSDGREKQGKWLKTKRELNTYINPEKIEEYLMTIIKVKK